MKKLLLLSLLFIGALQSCSDDEDASAPNPEPVAECTYQGNIELSSQSEVDAFGALGYCAVNGSITIGNENNTASNITNLAAFKNILSIGGFLNIANNPNLTSLEGLHNLKFVGYFIVNNTGIEDFMGLRSLESISESTNTFTQIINNPNLKNLKGLEKLKRLERTEIVNNPALTSLEGLENIETIYSSLHISSNPLLSTLNLESIKSLDGLEINQTAIISISSLVNIKHIEYLILTNNPELISLHGLDGLTSINNNLKLENLPKLTSIQAMGNVTSLGSLHISNCDALTSLEGLGGVAETREVNIVENDGLVSLNGLQNLTRATSLYINGNASLNTIEHLLSLTTIYNPNPVNPNSTTLSVSGNNSLSSLHGLENLNGAYWIYINNNNSLQDLCAIRHFMPTIAAGNISITGNLNPVTPGDIYNGNCN